MSAFAVWITGLPASGKTTLANALLEALSQQGTEAALLDSDALRTVLTPHPTYDEAERDTFYNSMAYIGQLLTRHGVSVIFSATANRRAYRNQARQEIPHFLEVYLDCPLSVCMDRDPKGIYKSARSGKAESVPGLQSSYEPPEHPEVIIQGEQTSPQAGAKLIIEKLTALGYLPPLTAK